MTAERMMNQEKLCNAINALTDDDAAYLLSLLSENRAFKPVSRSSERDYTMPTIPLWVVMAAGSAGVLCGVVLGFFLAGGFAHRTATIQERFQEESQGLPSLRQTTLPGPADASRGGSIPDSPDGTGGLKNQLVYGKPERAARWFALADRYQEVAP